MMTQRSTSWTLLAVLAGALATTACKKNADTQAPDVAANGDAANDLGGDDDSDASEPAEPEFLTVNDFEDTMQGKNGDIGDCFAAAREAKPELAGKLAYDFTVGGDGKISDIKPDPASTIKDEALDKCVREKASGWSFPKTRDGKPMTLPYTFNLS